MNDEDDVVNGILGKVCELDGGRRLQFKRVFAEGLLEVDCLRERRQFKVLDEVTGELRIPDTRWLDDMLRQGRLRMLDDQPVRTPDRAALEMDREQILEKAAEWFYDQPGRRIIDVCGEVRRLVDLHNLQRAIQEPVAAALSFGRDGSPLRRRG